MSNDLAKFDPETLANQVSARIRGTIAELIPEDAWKAMVKVEVDRFTQPGTSMYNGPQPSGLTKVVREELEKAIRASVREVLASNEWAPFWDGEKQKIGPAIAQLVNENAGEILAGILKTAVSDIVQQIRNRMT